MGKRKKTAVREENIEEEDDEQTPQNVGESSSSSSNDKSLYENEIMPPKRRNTVNSRRRAQSTNAETVEELVARRVADAIAQYEASRVRDNAINGSRTTENIAWRNRINERTNTTGDPMNVQRGCSYKSFLACKPTNFHRNEGVIGIVNWIEKMESILDISNCSPDCMVKYVTCTLADETLTWWNAQVQILGRETANSISWEELKTMILEEFCPRSEFQKIETELWNIKMFGSDVTAYTTKFQELARLVPHMVTPEYKHIERYIWGLVPQIRSLVTSSRPATFKSAVSLAQTLTDEAVRMRSLTKKSGSSTSGPSKVEGRSFGADKKKWGSGGNDRQGQQFDRRHGNSRVFTATTSTISGYQGNRPKCGKCERHHEGKCTFCGNCKQWGHQAQTCKVNPPTRANNDRRNTGCFECGDLNHYRNKCPELNNNNNRANNNVRLARGRAFVIGAQ